ncbi:MAG TPA: ERF family protein [Egibacteraceae bacterium]|jgi:hypothetical protein|nr:ERF family protein [Egibacteraceae bacterium]
MTEPPVVVALSKVMEDVRAVRKGDRNQQQGYAFRGIDAVVNAVGPALRRHGVVVVPMLEEVHYRDVTTSTGKPSRECTVKVRYRFHGPAGDYIDCVTPGESMDFGDKGAPKAMSVAYRIALLQALCLPTDESDADAQTYERAPTPPPRQEAPADLARAALRATCTENGYDLTIVANRYKAQAGGTALREETDAARIEAFRQALSGVPSHELVATNGAPT